MISETVPIKSPMDRLDALDALNALLRAKIKVRIDGDGEHRDVSLVKVSVFQLVVVCMHLHCIASECMRTKVKEMRSIL